jgi:hypothetical protein
MDFTTLPSLSGEALTEALALDFSTLDNDALATELNERSAHVTGLFALTAPSIAQVNVAEALVASVHEIEAEQAERTKAVEDAAERFAAARASFAAEDGADDGADDGAEDGAEDGEGDGADGAEDGDGAESAAAEDAGAEDGTDEGDGADDGADEGGDAGEGDGVTTASARNSQKVKALAKTATKVAARNKRPAVKKTSHITITAAADVPGFGVGAEMSDMDTLTKGLLGRVKGFAPYNARSARAMHSQSGGMPVVTKVPLAQFGLTFPEAMVASGNAGGEYHALKEAIKNHKEAIVASMKAGETITASALTAAGWCAPSPIAYNYVADYVVDGLITVPEVSAPRGGLYLTTGPQKSSQDEALDNFGWTQTEEQAEARTEKTFETIECPEFVDHRLDAVGYGFTIPILTQKAYPEIVTDALRYANVLYAHRTNRRIISDLVALSTAVTFSGYGSSFTDALEALSLIAVAERRRWDVGQNAVMEVKAPSWAMEVFRADMSRRNGIAKDSVSDGDIARHFADRRLAVEYVADWQEISVAGGALVLQGEFDVMMYPSGTFAKAVEDVINLSATYDAASLTVNEYTGVFFEQGLMTLKTAYGSSLVTVPVNTAGEQGALDLTSVLGPDHVAGGSF